MKELNLGGKRSEVDKLITLYHGSPSEVVVPTYGKGKDRHDYGRGFYLTPDKELAREWAMGSGSAAHGWVHTYQLDCSNLTVLNFEDIKKFRALYWAAELVQHREPDDREERGIYYDDYKNYLVSNYGMPVDKYDVVTGWRADDSYFQIVLRLLNDELQVPLLEEALRIGQLGIQYCCRSQSAFEALAAIGQPEEVPNYYRKRYMERDRTGRHAFSELLKSDRNKYGKPRVTMQTLVFDSRGEM